MKTARRAAPLAVAAVLAACAGWRWSGAQAPDGRSAKAALHAPAPESPAPPPAAAAAEAPLAVSTAPLRAPVVVAIPEAPVERRRSSEFYSDLGPDEIDVSAYPAQQRYDYAVFARACARCHTLARSVNAPLATRGWWEFYILGMRMRSRWQGRPLSPEEVKQILDFLDYDSRVRKVERAREFEALTEELKRRFDQSLAERLGELQRKNPNIRDGNPHLLDGH